MIKYKIIYENENDFVKEMINKAIFKNGAGNILMINGEEINYISEPTPETVIEVINNIAVQLTFNTELKEVFAELCI